MSEGILRQIVRTTDPSASPTGYVDLYYKSGQYYFINSSGTISGVGVSTEFIEDTVANFLLGGTGIDAVYNDAGNTLTIDIDSATYALITGALQPGDNVSQLTNDANYITSAGAPVQSVNGDTGVVVLTKADVGLGNVDDVSAADLRDRTTHTGTQAISTITATAGTFLGVDNLGAAESIVNWSRNAQGGVDVNQSGSPSDVGSSSIVYNRFNAVLTPTENITDSYYQSSDIFTIDGTFDTGNVAQKEAYLTHSSTGTIGNLTNTNLSITQSRGDSTGVTGLNNSIQLGDSVNTSSSGFVTNVNAFVDVTADHTNTQAVNAINSNINVADTAVVNYVNGMNHSGNLSGVFSGATGYSYNQGVTSTGSSTGYMSVLTANPDIDGTLEGFAAVSIYGYGDSAPNQFQGVVLQPNYSGTNMQTYTGVSISHNMTTMDNFNGIFINPNNGFTCDNFSGISITPNMSSVTNYASGLKVEPVIGTVKYLDAIYADATQVTVYAGVQGTVTIQDLTFEWNTPGEDANDYTIEYTTGGTAGSEVVSILGTDITVQIESGVSTATQIKTAMELISQINTAMTITISGVGSNTQTAVGPQSFTGGDWPGQARAAYFKGNVQIDGALAFSGALSIGALNAFSQLELVASPPFPTSIHSMISGFYSDPSTTYTAADSIGTNTASLMTFGANSTVTAGFLGVAALGLPAVVTTHTGCTVERVSGATFAISMDVGSTGGTLETVSLCRAVAIPNGVTTVDRLIGYEYSLPFGDPGTESWGVYINPAVNNWLAGDLKIGGTSGSTDKVQNSSVGLEIEGKALLHASLTTTERDALTALNGMVIYNETTDKLQVRAAGSWVDLH